MNIIPNKALAIDQIPNSESGWGCNDFYKCPICKGENLTVWYPRYRKYPKCGGWMKRAKSGPILLWD